MSEHGKGYLTAEEAEMTSAFLNDGHVIMAVEDRAALDRLRDAVVGLAAEHLGIANAGNPQAFLDQAHDHVDAGTLNQLRLFVINGVNKLPWVRDAYFALVRGALENLVGNELAVQRRLNLSIQLPDDESSLLHVHADVWDGDSPYEVVVWLPLVDCRGTKGMYLLPPGPGERHARNLADFDGRTADDLFDAIEPDLVWPDLPYGDVMIFSQNLMHGNRVNQTPETRWSMNCRFKGLFTPYADKRLGEFFEPLNVKPASRLGMNYTLPNGFGKGRGDD